MSNDNKGKVVMPLQDILDSFSLDGILVLLSSKMLSQILYKTFSLHDLTLQQLNLIMLHISMTIIEYEKNFVIQHGICERDADNGLFNKAYR